MRIGFFGFGKMGRLRAAIIDRLNDNVEFFVYDQGVSELSESHDLSVSFVHTCDDLLSLDLRAIFVCGPSALNTGVVIKALKAGINVFSEKPPGVSFQDAVQMHNVFKNSKSLYPYLKLAFGFNHRHHPGIRKIKSLLDDGDLGDLLWMRGRYGKEVSADFWDSWRGDVTLAGRGIFLDQGLHMLDIFSYLAGEFDSVKASVSNRYWSKGLEDNVFAIFEKNNGVVASLHSTMTQWRYLFSLEVFGTEGFAILNGLKTPSGNYGSETLSVGYNHQDKSGVKVEAQKLVFEYDDSFELETQEFLRPGSTPVVLVGSDYACSIMRLVDDVYQNA